VEALQALLELEGAQVMAATSGRKHWTWRKAGSSIWWYRISACPEWTVMNL